jgi:hypothetical protein
MKVLATPQFTKRVETVSESARDVIKQVLMRLDRASDQSWPAGVGLPVKTVGGDIFAIAAGRLRVFVSVGRDAAGNQYLLLLDVADAGASESGLVSAPPSGAFLTAWGDPRSNPKRNPNINPSLNPNINPKLNPNINPSLNPNINPSLNPNINPSLNPNINPSLNPNINPSLNPNINPSLNPNINPSLNPSINPRFGRSFAGLYLYDLSLEIISYFVVADDKVMLRFNLDNVMIGIEVRNDQHGFSSFDTSNAWTGYLLLADEESNVYLSFNRNNEWTGMAA